MVRFAAFNPQDRLFFAYDRALRRFGLPGIHIQVHLELIGRLDIERFKRSIRALHRRYPATAGRLVCHPVTGSPAWELSTAPQDLNAILRIETLSPPTEEEFHRRAEELLGRPMEAFTRPPLQFHVFRGLPAGDVVVVRWPHAFMDVRGFALLAGDIEALYQSCVDPDEVNTAGDELRRDFEDLLAGITWEQSLNMLGAGIRAGRAHAGHDLWLPGGPVVESPGRIRYLSRYLTTDQTRAIQQAAMRICGFARFGDFVRACAIRAMHHCLSRQPRNGDVYSTLNMIDHRKRRQRGPVCHNLFSGLPLRVPAVIADDRRKVAAELAAQTERILNDGGIIGHLAAVRWLSRLPTALLAECMFRNLCSEGRARLPLAFGTPPSIQVGFAGASGQNEQRFCGLLPRAVYGVGVPPPLAGFAIDLNVDHDRLHVTSTYWDRRVSRTTMEKLLDRFVAELLNPE